MRTFTRKAVTEDNPESLPECYGHIPENLFSHEQCGICKIREICKEAKEIPILSYEPYHDILENIENGSSAERDSFLCPKSEDFIYWDDDDKKHRTYNFDEMLQLLIYVFKLTPLQFYYVRVKILHPEFTLQQIAHPMGVTRQNISKRFQELIREHPELFNILRIFRHRSTQRPETAKQNN